jgi:hypothetical protein
MERWAYANDRHTPHDRAVLHVEELGLQFTGDGREVVGWTLSGSAG